MPLTPRSFKDLELDVHRGEPPPEGSPIESWESDEPNVIVVYPRADIRADDWEFARECIAAWLRMSGWEADVQDGTGCDEGGFVISPKGHFAKMACPCPKCQHAPEVLSMHGRAGNSMGWWHAVVCWDCGVRTEGGDLARVVAEWNDHPARRGVA